MDIEEYKTALANHDWFHYMSDDHSVYLRGCEKGSELKRIAEEGTDEHRKAYNEAYAIRFHREPFAPPYAFPFPNL